MNTITHIVRSQHTDLGDRTHRAVSLPAIPGVIIDRDRSETEPHQRIIRHGIPRRAAVGAAARVEMFRAALIEVMRDRA